MSCILRVFKKKKSPLVRVDSEPFSFVVSLEGPLPETQAELYLLEDCLAKRMSYINKKANLAYSNAIYSNQKGNISKYLQYINERKRLGDEIERLGKRIMEVVEKQNELAFQPPLLVLPPPAKFENETRNPVQLAENVPNHPSPQVVSTLPIGRTRTHIADFLSPSSSHLHSGT